MIKTLVRASGVVDFLRRYDTYIILGHKEPDGDCLGSQLALASFLERGGKKTLLVSTGPFSRTEVSVFEPRFRRSVHSGDIAGSGALVVVDCSLMERIGIAPEDLPAGLPLAFIDHHASGKEAGDCRIVVPSAPSTTYIVQHILELMGGGIHSAEAELLLFGLSTDTGFFRHLDENSAPIFEAAARLIQAGASPKKTFAAMYGGKSLDSRKLMGELLTRAQSYYDGKLIITRMNLDDHARYGLVGRDSDMLYQLFLGVEGMEVAVVVREETPGYCSVGLRSRSQVDVGAVAASFGGGGHKLASGMYVQGASADVAGRIVTAFQSILSA